MTLQRCPGCRMRLAQEPEDCPRCGCDLRLVRRAEEQAGQYTQRAIHAWARGEREQARALAQAALAIQDDLLARAVLRALERS